MGDGGGGRERGLPAHSGGYLGNNERKHGDRNRRALPLCTLITHHKPWPQDRCLGSPWKTDGGAGAARETNAFRVMWRLN